MTLAGKHPPPKHPPTWHERHALAVDDHAGGRVGRHGVQAGPDGCGPQQWMGGGGGEEESTLSQQQDWRLSYWYISRQPLHCVRRQAAQLSFYGWGLSDEGQRRAVCAGKHPAACLLFVRGCRARTLYVAVCHLHIYRCAQPVWSKGVADSLESAAGQEACMRHSMRHAAMRAACPCTCQRERPGPSRP